MWHLNLGDEVQLYYLHMKKSLQLLKKTILTNNFALYAQFGAFFICFCSLFAFSFLEAVPPLAIGCILLCLEPESKQKNIPEAAYFKKLNKFTTEHVCSGGRAVPGIS